MEQKLAVRYKLRSILPVVRVATLLTLSKCRDPSRFTSLSLCSVIIYEKYKNM